MIVLHSGHSLIIGAVIGIRPIADDEQFKTADVRPYLWLDRFVSGSKGIDERDALLFNHLIALTD